MDTYKKIVEQINAQMRENGHSFKRTPVECRSRVKRLKTHYFKTKKVNKKSGGRRTSFLYYEWMDRVLGRRLIVEPVAQCDSIDCAEALHKWQSNRLNKHRHLPFSLPNAHSTVILALDNR